MNELIKGLLLFFTLGLLYFIFTLLVEYFLWLKPLQRSILFWVFVLVEVFLLAVYILVPLFKIWGFKKGISEEEASKIIGNYFPEVKDKLLNMLQLQNLQQHSELIEASIEQKSKDLQPIPFKRAIDFSGNKKYVKYAIIPIIIWLATYITGNISVFNDSLTRVVHHATEFEPPAPFAFQIMNTSLQVIEGNSYTLQVKTVGDVIPEDAKIHFNNQNYYLENLGNGHFQFHFINVKNNLNFYLTANNVSSKTYNLNSLPTPVITGLKMQLQYPSYTQKKNELIENTGNAIVPQGTIIQWDLETDKTTQVALNKDDKKTVLFNKKTENTFSLSEKIHESFNYAIAT